MVLVSRRRYAEKATAGSIEPAVAFSDGSSKRRPPPGGSVQLLARIVQDAPGYYDHVDLLGALENVVDLRVAHPFLHQIAARVTQRSQQFDRLLRYQRDGEARLGLRHRGLQAVAHSHVEHPRRPPRE